MNNTPLAGMADDQQLDKIRELVSSPDFKLPLSSFLKDITRGEARSIDELTSAQAKEVINVFKKFTKKN